MPDSPPVVRRSARRSARRLTVRATSSAAAAGSSQNKDALQRTLGVLEMRWISLSSASIMAGKIAVASFSSPGGAAMTAATLYKPICNALMQLRTSISGQIERANPMWEITSSTAPQHRSRLRDFAACANRRDEFRMAPAFLPARSTDCSGRCERRLRCSQLHVPSRYSHLIQSPFVTRYRSAGILER
jgi:hypothetical protein